MTKQEQNYINKIEELKAQRDDAAKSLGLVQDQIDAAKGELTRLTEKKTKLESTVNELKHEVENIQQNIDSKKAEGLKTVQELSDQLAQLKLQAETADFTLKNLTAKIDDLAKKKTELLTIEQEYIQSTARLDAARKQAEEAEAENEKAKAQRDSLLDEARKVNEAAHIREQTVALAEQKLKEAQDTTEFYRNRIIGYCVEKGLPVPDFQNG